MRGGVLRVWDAVGWRTGTPSGSDLRGRGSFSFTPGWAAKESGPKAAAAAAAAGHYGKKGLLVAFEQTPRRRRAVRHRPPFSAPHHSESTALERKAPRCGNVLQGLGLQREPLWPRGRTSRMGGYLSRESTARQGKSKRSVKSEEAGDSGWAGWLRAASACARCLERGDPFACKAYRGITALAWRSFFVCHPVPHLWRVTRSQRRRACPRQIWSFSLFSASNLSVPSGCPSAFFSKRLWAPMLTFLPFVCLALLLLPVHAARIRHQRARPQRCGRD